jgi:nucleoside-diphosphate-sugar epimerase
MPASTIANTCVAPSPAGSLPVSRGETALVTGAGGFVGANLVRRLLDAGVDVHAMIRPSTDPWRLHEVRDRVSFHTVDLIDRDTVFRVVHRVRPGAIFHLAKHRGDPAALDYRAAYDANLNATMYLLEAARELPLERFVHAGSSLEYDLTQSPLKESSAPVPRTVHGVTKAAAAMLCQQFARRFDVPAVVLRFFTVYGPWEGPARFVPRVMMAAIDGRPLAVTHERVSHDWVFVDDVVDACVRSVTAAGVVGEIFNVATGRATVNQEIVAFVEGLVGAPIARADAHFPARAWDTDRWVADVSKSRDRLGWVAATDLAAGLERTLIWFRAHAPHYRDRLASR